MLLGSGRIWIVFLHGDEVHGQIPFLVSLLLRQGCLRPTPPELVEVVEERLPLGDVDSRHGRNRVMDGKRRGDP